MNIKITNIDTNHIIIVNKKIFNSIKTILSENSIYEETNEPVTFDGGMKDENYRTTVI